MYFQIFRLACIAVGQFLWLYMLLRSRKLRSTIWGPESYTILFLRVASQPGYRSSVWFCKFIGLYGSLLISNHGNGCKISIEKWKSRIWGREWYPFSILLVPQNRQGYSAIMSPVMDVFLKGSGVIWITVDHCPRNCLLISNTIVRYITWGPESYNPLPLCILE